MRKEFKHSIGKHDIKVIYDKDSILAKIMKEKEAYEENGYQRYYNVGYVDGYLTQEEYCENLEKMISLLEKITTEESMTDFIVRAHKKKNGTLHKGRHIFRVGCDNTTYITEWHNTWIYNALNVSAIDDLTLEINYIKITDTPA